MDYVVSGEADGLIADLCRLAVERGREVEPSELPRGVLGPRHRKNAGGPCQRRRARGDSRRAAPHRARQLALDAPLVLDCGLTLPGATVNFETYGSLTACGDSAILVCHSLTHRAHAAGRHAAQDPARGWWDGACHSGLTFRQAHPVPTAVLMTPPQAARRVVATRSGCLAARAGPAANEPSA